MQHGQIKPAAVPRDDLRCVALDAIEESLDDIFLAVVNLAQRPGLEPFVGAHHARDRDDFVLMQWQEITAARVLTTTLKHQLGDGVVAHGIIQALQFAQAVNVGNGFDIEYEDGGHGSR